MQFTEIYSTNETNPNDNANKRNAFGVLPIVYVR